MRINSPRRGLLIEIVLVLLFALFFSVYLTRPLAFDMKDHAVELGDSRLNAYVQAWVAHSLAADPRQLFDTNMFYPAKDTLALSENMLGNQLIFGPVYAVTKNPILASNCVILASFWLCGLSMYLLIRYLTASPWAAAIGGLIFAFAPVRFSQMGHMQLLSMEWMPLSVLFAYRFVVRRTPTNLIAFCCCVTIQVLSSLYLGYIEVVILLAVIMGLLLTAPRFVLNRKTILSFGLGAIAVGLVLLPVVVPYLRLQRGGVLLPGFDVTNTIGASASPIASYLNGQFGSHPLYGQLLGRFHSIDYDWEKVLFPGFLPILLSIIAIARWLVPERDPQSGVPPQSSGTAHRDDRNSGVASLRSASVMGAFLTVAASYVLTLGPYLRIHDQPSRIRLPYFWLQRWIPGMSEFRVPARFALGLMFGLAILAGTGFLYVLRTAERWRMFQGRQISALFTCVAVLFLMQEFDFAPFHLDTVMTPASVAPEYRWLAAQRSGSATLELPITKDEAGFDAHEAAGYVFASAFHWQPLVNGYSGHLPLVYHQMETWAREMPSPIAGDVLRKMGVRYIILHTDRIPSTALRYWQPMMSEAGLIEITRFGPAVIYQLADSPTCRSQLSELTLGLQVPNIGQIGKDFLFLLSLYSPDHCWVDGHLSASREIEGEWIEERSGRVVRFVNSIALPPALRVGEMELVLASAHEPPPGTYKFHVISLDHEMVQLPIQEVNLTDLPRSTSVNSPDGLSAEYQLKALSPVFRAGAKATIEFYARNIGSAIWLARPPSPAGSVGLGYTWHNATGKEVKTGRIYLQYPVYPGSAYTFMGPIDVPDEPGDYSLSLELVSELVRWFHDVGVKPINIKAEVRP